MTLCWEEEGVREREWERQSERDKIHADSQHHLDYLLQLNKGRRTHKCRRVHACQPSETISGQKDHTSKNWNKSLSRELFGEEHSFALREEGSSLNEYTVKKSHASQQRRRQQQRWAKDLSGHRHYIILTQALCVVQSSRVGCQMPLSVSCWCQVMMLRVIAQQAAGNCCHGSAVCALSGFHHQNALKRLGWQREGMLHTPKVAMDGVTVWERGGHLGTCCTLIWIHCGCSHPRWVSFLARGHQCINAQGHLLSLTLMGSPPRFVSLSGARVRIVVCNWVATDVCVSSVVVGDGV